MDPMGHDFATMTFSQIVSSSRTVPCPCSFVQGEILLMGSEIWAITTRLGCIKTFVNNGEKHYHSAGDI